MGEINPAIKKELPIRDDKDEVERKYIIKYDSGQGYIVEYNCDKWITPYIGYGTRKDPQTNADVESIIFPMFGMLREDRDQVRFVHFTDVKEINFIRGGNKYFDEYMELNKRAEEEIANSQEITQRPPILTGYS